MADVYADWEDLAACKGSDASLFFGPHRFEPKRDRESREAIAKSICAECPVRPECLEHALAAGEHFGIWGGLNERERRTLIQERQDRRS